MLLDTHAFYWLAGERSLLSENALVAIAESQAIKALYLCPITAWELLIAAQKLRNAPTLGDQPFEAWFRSVRRKTAAKLIPISERIAIQAAIVAGETGHKDPGDCYIMATAKVRDIPILTRDAAILKIATSGYVSAIAC